MLAASTPSITEMAASVSPSSPLDAPSMVMTMRFAPLAWTYTPASFASLAATSSRRSGLARTTALEM